MQCTTFIICNILVFCVSTLSHLKTGMSASCPCLVSALPPGSCAEGPVRRADQKARGSSCLWWSIQDCRGPLTFPRREAKTCTPCPPKYMKPFAWDGFVQKIMKRYSLHLATLLHHLAPPSNLSISSKTVSSFSLLTLQWSNEAWDHCDQQELPDTGTLKSVFQGDPVISYHKMLVQVICVWALLCVAQRGWALSHQIGLSIFCIGRWQ